MTLVASFSVNRHPVLVGDLMLSREWIDSSMNIPTCTDVNRLFPVNVSRKVLGLKQKVVVINKNLALAWSGDLDYAIKVITNINNKAAKDGLTIANIKQFLNSQHYDGKGTLYLTGLLFDENQSAVARFGWQSRKGFFTNSDKNEVLGEIYVGGSGQVDFLALAKNLPKDARSIATGNGIETPICFSLSILGQLTGQQMRLGTGLTSYYGGGYEIVTLENGELKKISDIAYHMLEAKRDKDGQLKITFHGVLKYEYWNDLLLIRKFDINVVAKKVEENKAEHELYVIYPPHKESDDSEKLFIENNVTWPHLEGRFNIFYIYKPRTNSVVSLVQYTGNKPSCIQYSFEGDFLKWQLSSELIERINNSVK